MRKTVGLGEDNFQTLIEENHFFIDKTLFIQEFLNSDAKVALVTRPRRFGKTLNMSMLASFLDITKNTKSLFEDKKIMQTACANEINQYPVIFVSFKNAKGEKEDAIKLLKKALFDEYKRFDFIYEHLSNNTKEEYKLVWQGLKNQNNMELTDINDCLQLLCQFLYEYYGKKVILLIDEYDTPFIEAHNHGYYDEVHSGLAAILITSLKGNDYLKKAMLTGIQRIAKENIFSGLNNLSVYGVNHEKYAIYFGLLENEAKMFLEYFGLDFTKEVKDLYDGYRIGGIEIYNPWSISNYASEKKLDTYWKNSSNNVMVKKALGCCSTIFSMKYNELIANGETIVNADLSTSYYEDIKDATLWALLINSGYLTIIKTIDRDTYKVKIPNEEVREDFKDITAHYLHIDNQILFGLETAFKMKNFDEIRVYYQTYIMETSSYHDFIDENSCHMLFLGLCAYLYNSYKINSNREAGLGRYDILLESKNISFPNYILEFKYTKEKDKCLKTLAQEAIQQIIDLNYATELNGEVLYVGIGQRGKQAEIIFQIR